MTQLDLFAPAEWTKRGTCDICGGVILTRRTAAFYEDDWRCEGCPTRGTTSWSREFGPRHAEAVEAGR